MEAFREQERRFTALREKLEYGVYHVVAPLQIEGYVTAEPVDFKRRDQIPGQIMHFSLSNDSSSVFAFKRLAIDKL